jgi:hypothetical protein
MSRTWVIAAFSGTEYTHFVAWEVEYTDEAAQAPAGNDALPKRQTLAARSGAAG